MQTTDSLIDNAQLITKIYFPRLLIPLATVLSGLVDFALGFLALLGTLLVYGFVPIPRMIAAPICALLAVASALGVGLWLSALNVQFRDIKYTVPFLNQLWLFASPIAYPTSMLPKSWQIVYGLNPIVGVVEGLRWCLGADTDPLPLILVSALVTTALLVSGAYYFRRMEKSFADVV